MTQEALPLPVTRGETIEIVFPFTPKSVNQLGAMPYLHRRSYRDKWLRYLGRGLPQVAVTAVEVEVEIVFGSKRTRDWQNYAGVAGLIANGLVEAGVIPDDSPEHFRVGANGGIRFTVDGNTLIPAKQRQRTILRITPIE